MAQRRSAEEVERLLEGYQASGLTRTEYCRRESIPVTTLDCYRRRKAGKQKGRLVKVVVKPKRREPYVDGQKIGTYTITLALYNGTMNPQMTDNTGIKLSTFFGGKRLGTYDRLCTAKFNQQNSLVQSFYPDGEDRGTIQPNDSLKFATYTRDTATGLDYADQRYYANNFGRFSVAEVRRVTVYDDATAWAGMKVFAPKP